METIMALVMIYFFFFMAWQMFKAATDWDRRKYRNGLYYQKQDAKRRYEEKYGPDWKSVIGRKR